MQGRVPSEDREQEVEKARDQMQDERGGEQIHDKSLVRIEKPLIVAEGEKEK